MKELPIKVMLEWVDAQSIDGVLELKDLHNLKPAHAYIIGFLVKVDKENFFIAKEYWETGQFKYLHIVPKRSVIKQTVL